VVILVCDKDTRLAIDDLWASLLILSRLGGWHRVCVVGDRFPGFGVRSQNGLRCGSLLFVLPGSGYESFLEGVSTLLGGIFGRFRESCSKISLGIDWL
ncbi:hypothetical protein Tco_1090844, partial [Tanacetum coccineum]